MEERAGDVIGSKAIGGRAVRAQVLHERGDHDGERSHALLAVDHVELVLRRLRETVGRIEHRADEVRVARAARAVDVLPQPLALLQAPGVHALVHRDDELGVFCSQKVEEQLLFGLHA